jgi:hypothetical protein
MARKLLVLPDPKVDPWPVLWESFERSLRADGASPPTLRMYREAGCSRLPEPVIAARRSTRKRKRANERICVQIDVSRFSRLARTVTHEFARAYQDQGDWLVYLVPSS